MSYNVHDTIVKWFLREYARPAVPGHAKISLTQVCNTDEEIFVRLAALTRTGLQLALDGSYPLDALLPTVLKEQRVTMHMAALQLTNPALRMLGDERASKAQSDKTKAEKRMNQELNNLRAENKKSCELKRVATTTLIRRGRVREGRVVANRRRAEAMGRPCRRNCLASSAPGKGSHYGSALTAVAGAPTPSRTGDAERAATCAPN